MEVLDLITRILYITAIVVVVVGPLATMVLTCRQVTGTWDVRHFYGNSRYWAMSILNFRYIEKKAEGMHIESPIEEYSKAFIEMQGKRKALKATKERIEGMESEAKSIKNLDNLLSSFIGQESQLSPAY